jgi:hypothetical protein
VIAEPSVQALDFDHLIAWGLRAEDCEGVTASFVVGVALVAWPMEGFIVSLEPRVGGAGGGQ